MFFSETGALLLVGLREKQRSKVGKRGRDFSKLTWKGGRATKTIPLASVQHLTFLSILFVFSEPHPSTQVSERTRSVL
jgi:hypothetical protein